MGKGRIVKGCTLCTWVLECPVRRTGWINVLKQYAKAFSGMEANGFCARRIVRRSFQSSLAPASQNEASDALHQTWFPYMQPEVLCVLLSCGALAMWFGFLGSDLV